VESARDARPLGLYFWGKKWTLAAWCESRADYRSFRPDRMRGLHVLERSFDPADGISLAGFVAKGDPADWESWEWRREASEPPDVTRDTASCQAAGAASFASARERAGRVERRST
jgi:predicted DNA-binding transcriptional regulator YafY